MNSIPQKIIEYRQLEAAMRRYESVRDFSNASPAKFERAFEAQGGYAAYRLYNSGNAAAYQYTPEWVRAVNTYNAGGIFPDNFVGVLSALDNYYTDGAARPGSLSTEMARAAFAQWNVDAAPSGIMRAVDTIVPVLAVAGVAYLAAPIIAGALSGTASTTAMTTADTYAAMTGAAGLTSSGSVAADIALANAVQIGTLPLAAAQSYASAIAAGNVAESAVIAGLSETSFASGLTVADVVGGIPNTDAFTGVSAPAVTTTANVAGAATTSANVVDAVMGIVGSVGAAALNPETQPKPAQSVTRDELNVGVIIAALAAVGGLVFLT